MQHDSLFEGTQPIQSRPKESHQLINQSKTVEWYTPPWCLALVREVLGTIDLDPASCEAAQRTVQASQYYTIHDNGLT